MVTTRLRRRMRRLAATLLVGVLIVGGLVTAAIYVGPTLWVLTAPADRLGALVAEAERERAQRYPPEPPPADGARGLTGLVSRVSARATAAGATVVDDAPRAPFARVGARISVAAPAAVRAQLDDA